MEPQEPLPTSYGQGYAHSGQHTQYPSPAFPAFPAAASTSRPYPSTTFSSMPVIPEVERESEEDAAGRGRGGIYSGMAGDDGRRKPQMYQDG